MLDQVTIETFEPLVGSSFWVHTPGHKVEMRLEKAARVMESEAARVKRTPFSLFFVGPPSIYLEQKTYRVQHETFAEPMEIFLVPVGKEPDVYLYEAVFT